MNPRLAKFLDIASDVVAWATIFALAGLLWIVTPQ